MSRQVTTARLVPVLVGLAMIVVAAVGFRLSSQPEGFQVVRGTLGDVTRYNKGVAGVSSVRVGTELRDGDRTVTTPGMFVVVRLTVRADRTEEVKISRAQLLSADATYEPFGIGATVRADPGFSSSRDVAFEVAPGRLTDLTVQGYDTGVVSGYHQRLRVHLGITAANAGQWAAAAQGQRIIFDNNEYSAGLA